MPDVQIRRVETEADLNSVRALCRVWVDWQLKEFPEHRDSILSVFEPAAYARTLEELPVIHAGPKGAILIALLGGRPVGCVMYHEMEPGITEIKRLFVDESGRGHGIGRSLLVEMFDLMRADGYPKVRFSSAVFLTHARRLYESVGFADIPQPSDFPPHLHDVVYFMERDL